MRGLLATAPLATMILSKSLSWSKDETAVLKRISTPLSFISLLYQANSSLSFSLKDGAAAALNTPPSLSDFSKITGLCPRKARTLAASIPAIPPPIMATFFADAAFTILYLLCCIVGGLIAQRAIPMLSVRDWSFATPL